uniref:Homeobox-leucine zipper protein HDG2 n=1 Tax=Davidia involucrata TaxID=16924 RepID=A0A5B7CAW4_DAVIN
MPAGIMIPVTNMPSMIRSNGNVAGFGSSSGLTLGQPNMMESQLHPLDMVQNTCEGDMVRIRDDDFENKSGSENQEGGSGDDQDPNPPPRKKRYSRHTQHQIQEMEAFFKDCPHPDDKQRKEMGRQLGLEPLQIKFWFQNKRTQMKTHNERQENTQLRAENERLRAENMRYREAFSNVSCPNCGGLAALGDMPFDDHLRLENARLREEVDRISTIAGKYIGKPMINHPVLSPPVTPQPLELGVGNFVGQPGIGVEMYGSGDLLRSMGGPTDQLDKPMIIEVAVAAMEELTRMAQMGEPLWMPLADGSSYVLNEDEYFRTFPIRIGSKPIEASRETAVVIMNHNNLVEILMDVNQWLNVFSGIVSRAMILEVLSTGVGGNYNGALQVMSAEFQVPSPLVPTRECYFVRYCKRHVDGTWAVADVSLDNLCPNPLVRCRRRPSGCLIQEMPNGYSKVTWVEHVEVDDRGVHNIYKPLVNSGLAFGAKRWVATLDRQCERLASAMARSVSNNDVGNTVVTTSEGRKSMLKLAERMVISFCAGGECLHCSCMDDIIWKWN